MIQLCAYANCSVMECEFSSSVDYHVIGNAYRCKVNFFNSTSQSENITDILGVHEGEKSFEDVKLFMIENQNISMIPRNLNLIFPNLEGIIIESCNLKSLSSYDLKNYPKLKFVYIGNNQIYNLPGDLFENNLHIEWLTFRNNYTKTIGTNLLKNLKNLEFASFIRNTCINRKAQSKLEIQQLINDIERNCSKY